MIKIFIILLLLSGLISCVVSTEKVENFSSVITASRNSDFTLGRGDRIAIDPAARISLPGDPQLQHQLQQILTQTLADELKKMGLEVGSVMSSKYLIGYAIAIDSELTDDDISSMFGLVPGYAGGTRQNYRRGTLLLDLYETASRTNVWRGALQTEIIGTLTPAQRKRKIEIAVGRLLRSMYR